MSIDAPEREIPDQRSAKNSNSITITFGTATVIVTALESAIVRLRYSPTGDFLPQRSWAVAKDDSAFRGAPLNVVEENADLIELATDALRIRVRRNDGGIELLTAEGHTLLQDAPDHGPLWTADNRIISHKVLPPDEYFYGFGERTSLLEKRGRRYTCWNTDPGDSNLDHGPGTDRMYQSIPFFMALRPQVGGYGLFFNNTFKTVFDVGHIAPDRLSIEAFGGELDYYLFYGAEPAAILEAYTSVTGRTPLPPRWALGYHQSRWGYYPETKVQEIVNEFRARQIPLDAIHLDIDYMDGYRVFTWDKTRFPDPATMTRTLDERGVKVVAILDAGVKYDPDGTYDVYNEGAERDYFIHDPHGGLFHGYVWPGDSVFPDFAKAEVQQWWGDLHARLVEQGVQGIWNDMNEPALASAPFGMPGRLIDIPDDAPQGSAGEPTTHAEVHNIYALLENKSAYASLRRLQPDTRPFILTRAGFAGIQRWAAVWTGDNAAAWEHLEMAMPQLANLGLSGVAFTGTDIGGYYWPSNPELWARWIELGAFYPFSRGHSVTDVPQKEPWVWGEITEQIARTYLELRYRLLPYLYTLFEESSRTGAPVLRPLLYEFHMDPQVFTLHDELMVGNALLIAPVYRPGVTYRHVYLPGGECWYDFWSGAQVQDAHILAHAPLDVLPMYVRGGTVLTTGPVMQYTGEKPIDRLTLDIYLDDAGSATGRLYEDDGISFAHEQGESCTTTYTVTTDTNTQIALAARREGRYQPARRSIDIRLHHTTGLKTYTLEKDDGNWELVL